MFTHHEAMTNRIEWISGQDEGKTDQNGPLTKQIESLFQAQTNRPYAQQYGSLFCIPAKRIAATGRAGGGFLWRFEFPEAARTGRLYRRMKLPRTVAATFMTTLKASCSSGESFSGSRGCRVCLSRGIDRNLATFRTWSLLPPERCTAMI